MKKADYIFQIKSILQHTYKLEKSETDESESKRQKYLRDLENKIIDLVKILEENNEINCETYNVLRPVGSKPRSLYEIAKIYKSIKLPRFLLPLLQPLNNNQCAIKDSFYFSKERIKL